MSAKALGQRNEKIINSRLARKRMAVELWKGGEGLEGIALILKVDMQTVRVYLRTSGINYQRIKSRGTQKLTKDAIYKLFHLGEHHMKYEMLCAFGHDEDGVDFMTFYNTAQKVEWNERRIYA